MSPLKEFNLKFSPKTVTSHEDDVVIIPTDRSQDFLKQIVKENYRLTTVDEDKADEEI